MPAGGDSTAATREPWLARCPGCGYDLTETDLDASLCPECGWEATEAERERARRRWLYLRSSRVVVPLLLVVLGGAGPALLHLFLSTNPDVVGRRSAAMHTMIPFAAGLLCCGPVVLLTRNRARLLIGAMWLRTLPWLLLPYFGAMGVRSLRAVLSDEAMAAVIFAAFFLYIPTLCFATYVWAKHWSFLSRRFGVGAKGWRAAGYACLAIAMAGFVLLWGIWWTMVPIL